MILLRVIKRVAGKNNIIINNPSSIRKALPIKGEMPKWQRGS